MNKEKGHHHHHEHDHGKHQVELNPEQLKTLIPYLKKHNLDHIGDLRKWHRMAVEAGHDSIAAEFGSIIELSEQIDRHLASALEIAERP